MPSTEDMDRLLKDYDASGGQWPLHVREPGCSRKALFRALVLTVICLISVSVGWFIHATVFMESTDCSKEQGPAAILSQFGKNEDGSVNFLDMINVNGLLDRINMSALSSYVIKNTPPDLAAKIVSHKDDFLKGDLMKIIQDVQLIDGVLDFLHVPETFAGITPVPTKVADYDYDHVAIGKVTTESLDAVKDGNSVGSEFLKSVGSIFNTKPEKSEEDSGNEGHV